MASRQNPPIFPETRSEALMRLEQFVPLAGAHYAAKRNMDLGPDKRGNVSMMSPYIRHRLITEQEVLASVLRQHTLSAAEKFIQEVFWRTYFKGHLETRPALWSRYRLALGRQVEALTAKGGYRREYERATEGRSGIDCFDAWVEELIQTGYLHNHARMWFASIWIFTLRLPWELGADFMYRHLLDGDPASNTLSWRWVGGLHTKGKTYLARRDNIIANTGGRFQPNGLSPTAEPLQEDSSTPAFPLPSAASRVPAGRIGLLLTEEDLCADDMDFADAQVGAIAGASAIHERSPLPVAGHVHAFTESALADGLQRASKALDVAAIRLPSLSSVTIADWARKNELRIVVTPYASVGPVAEALADAIPRLAAQNITIVQVRRAYDSLSWPHGTRGFFALKERIPEIIDALRIDDRQGGLFEGAAS
jgi:deoxyribodipyrimidine photo-lyase